MNLSQLLHQASMRLGEPEAAQHLLLHALDKPYSWIAAHADERVTARLIADYTNLIERRAAGEPVAYLTGQRGFWGLELEVTPATLIPRVETECLVELALKRLAADTQKHVADLGTGSGAVALALASERPLAWIVATDMSLTTLAVARHNARRLALHNVQFVCADWLAPIYPVHFDLIVSNPPYISMDDPHLKQGDLRFEPAMALMSGHDGLDAIRRMIHEAIGRLTIGGWLLFEHGHAQGGQVRALLHDTGYADIFTAQDLEARDRISGGQWTG